MQRATYQGCNFGFSGKLAKNLKSAAEQRQLDSAADLLKPAALNGLPSVSVIKSLRAVSEDDGSDAEALIDSMVERAVTISQGLRNKQEAGRWQLYARVAAWHREHHKDAEIERCPVCGTDLDKVPPDALLNKDVKEALRLCAEADADAAKGASEWEKEAAREFLEKLPESLRAFADKAPAGSLLEIYHKAYAEELFADKAFGTRLEPLKKNATAVWKLAVGSNVLPAAPPIRAADWPEEFRSGTLARRAVNVAAAVRTLAPSGRECGCSQANLRALLWSAGEARE